MKNVLLSLTFSVMALSACTTSTSVRKMASAPGLSQEEFDYVSPTLTCPNEIRYMDIWYETHKKAGLIFHGLKINKDSILGLKNGYYAGHIEIDGQIVSVDCMPYNAPQNQSDCFLEGRKLFSIDWASTYTAGSSVDSMSFADNSAAQFSRLSGKTLQCLNQKEWN